MDNLERFNLERLKKLRSRIEKCKGDYTLYAIDVDDVVYDTDPVMQRILGEIDKRATTFYREEIAREPSEDSTQEMEKSFKILNAILEETPYYEEQFDGSFRKIDYPRINYNSVYIDENLLNKSIPYMNQMLRNREDNEFYIYLSHCNPEREGIIKTERLYEHTPKIDGIMTLPFHVEVGKSEISSKAKHLLTNLQIDSLTNCVLIDNSKRNCRDWRNYGGTDIRFLPTGHAPNEDDIDRITKISSLDPRLIKRSLELIKYLRANPICNEESTKKLIKK